MAFNLIKRIYDVQYMVRPEKRVDTLPGNKQAYMSTLSISWPSALESILVSLVSIVDSVMVSTVGIDAVASVGITNQPKFVFLALIISLNAGITAFVSRRKGEGDYVGANNCLRQGLMISAALSAVLTVLSFFVARPLLVFAGAGSDIIGPATDYFKIVMIGVFFSSISLTINAAQRGVGNTKVSMNTNIAANIINLIFNYFLINGIWFFPRLGVRGAAIATVMGNFVAMLMSLYSVAKSGGFLHISRFDKWKLDSQTVRGVLGVSWGAAVEQVFMRIGFFLSTKTVASLGTVAYATYQICMNLLNLSFSFGDGLGVGASALVGQSLGAKRPDLAMMYGKVAQRLSLVISFVISCIFIFFRFPLLRMFTNDASVLATGSVIMIIMAAVSYFQVSQVVISGCLRGAGDTGYVAVTSLISVTFVRPVLTWLLCYPLGLGLIGAWFGLFFDQLGRLTMNLLRFIGGKWQKIKL